MSFTTAGVLPSESLAATQKQISSKQKTGLKSTKKIAKSGKFTKKTAEKSSAKRKRLAAIDRPDARYAALVVDANTGKVLYQQNAGALRYPASLTKMMTLYLTFDALKHGRMTLDTQMPVSAKAASQPQTNISLDEGDRLSMRTAIESLVVRSANDSSMVLAEAIGKTEWNFALMMTQKARELGMRNTVFRNPNGLPDNSQHTTAYDMAKLAIALRRDFPEYYHYFKKTSFTYNGVDYTGHNRVLARIEGADGLKTGFIRASGFNLVTSVKRGGVNLVGVVMGGSTAQARDNQMVSMLEGTIAQLETSKNSVASDKRSEVSPESETAYLYPDVPRDEGSGSGDVNYDALTPAAGAPIQ